MKLLAVIVLFFSFSAQAAVEQYTFSTKSVKVTANERSQGFTNITVEGFESSRNVGAPELPVKSLLVVGTPETISASVEVLETQRLANTKPMPAQVQRQPAVAPAARVVQWPVD